MRYEEELQAVQEHEAKWKAAAVVASRVSAKGKEKRKAEVVSEDEEEFPQKPVAPKKKKEKKVVEESDEVKVVKVAKGKFGAKKKIVEDEARSSAVATKPCER